MAALLCGLFMMTVLSLFTIRLIWGSVGGWGWG